MNKKEESKFTGQLNQSKNKGEFFCINYAMVCSMAKENASAEAIMAYIVLARGCNRRNDLLISTWGAEGITKKTGMSYRTAQKALGWLSSKEYIYNAQNMANIPGNLGKGSGKHHSARWVLPIGSGEHFIYLANAMIDGIGNGKNNPPFARIYGEAFSRTGPMSELRLDSIMVLLHLYLNHDLVDCGGIDPRIGVYREWALEGAYDGRTISTLNESSISYYEIRRGKRIISNCIADAALNYVLDSRRRIERFKAAFTNLEKLN